MFGTIQKWFSQPFNSNMSAQGWFAMVGLLFISLILWSMVLRRLEM